MDCNVTVGEIVSADIKSIAVMSPLIRVSNPPDNVRDGYQVKITTPDGKYSVRAYIWSDGTSSGGPGFNAMNLQIKNNLSVNDTIISNEIWLWSGAGGSTHNALVLPPNQWAGQSDNATSSSAGVWSAVTQTYKNYPSWGNEEVYAGYMPEHRIYTWMSQSKDSKVAYTLDFMAGSSTPSAHANTTTCPNGVCSSTKVYFIIQQVTAP
jgi:hypothetical protein